MICYVFPKEIERFSLEILRLNNVISQLEYQQLVMPDLADQFQDRIDLLKMQRDAFKNGIENFYFRSRND